LIFNHSGAAGCETAQMAIVVRAPHVLITASDARTGVPQLTQTWMRHHALCDDGGVGVVHVVSLGCGVSCCSLGVQLHTGPTRGTLA
jgi:hypothetical protein